MFASMLYVSVRVAPLAGAWIEIREEVIAPISKRQSLPSRERGLKLSHPPWMLHRQDVAPLAGAWIEIALHARYRV